MNEKKNMVYGAHPVENLLKSSLQLDKIVILKSISQNKIEKIIGLAKKQNVQIQWVGQRKELDDITRDKNHQGVVAFIKTQINYQQLEDFENSKSLLMLDHITDAGNFGAILRSCDQLGIDGVIIPQDRSIDVNATVIKASSGAAFFVPVIRVVNLARALEKLKGWGFWSYGAVGEEGDDLSKVDFAPKTLLILGSEGKGIGKNLLKNSDFKITIPTRGQIDSLNVSVAAAIILYQHSIWRAGQE